MSPPHPYALPTGGKVLKLWPSPNGLHLLELWAVPREIGDQWVIYQTQPTIELLDIIGFVETQRALTRFHALANTFAGLPPVYLELV